MHGKVGNSSVKPTALGIQAQSSVYGQTIPVIMGRTRVPVKLIWAANLRKSGGTNKPIKSKKKGTPSYAMNVDMLLGTNPIGGVLEFWTDNNQKLRLDFSGDYLVASDAIVGGLITVPDADFYYILGVTAEFVTPGNASADPYQLLWNAAYGGPDPVNPGGLSRYPFTYWWVPGSGPTLYFDAAQLGQMPDGALHVYYAKLTTQSHKGSKKQNSTASHVPVAALRLQFEPQLGEGTEFSGYTAQQIIYEHYAGLGSPNLDLGGGAALPNILAEVAGSFPIWPDHDADFVDMIQHIVKSGPTQCGFDAERNHSRLQQGLGCYDYPGLVQKKQRRTDTAGNLDNAFFDLPNTAGNILLVAVSSDGGAGLAISDDAGNGWTAVFPGDPARQVWYCSAIAWPAGNKVTITGLAGDNPEIQLMELAGLDTVDSVNYDLGSTAPLAETIDSTVEAGQPALLLALCMTASGATDFLPAAPPTNWKMEMGSSYWPNPAYQRPFLNQFVMSRVVRQPGTYTFSAQPGYSGSDRAVLLISFKNSEPARWPRPLGEILDIPSLELVRDQCRANSLKGSLALQSQTKAIDYLTDLCQAANAAPVWGGFVLQLVPWSETSRAEPQGTYVAPTDAGPLYDLTERDFLGDSGAPMVRIERTAQVYAPNLLQMQHPSRAADYNDVITAQPDQAGISVFGQRKEGPKQMACVQDPEVARKLLGISVRRQNYIRRIYKFRLNAQFKLLEPMDLVTITDRLIDLVAAPVRLTKVDEDEDYNLDCEAEDFIQGLHAPRPVDTTDNAGFTPDNGETPDSINEPIFLEPVARLAGLGNAPELWIGVSDPAENYGGAIAYLSTDGGSSYVPVGTINGNAATGVTVGDFPVAPDPDTANDLAVDLTESLGSLSNYGTADRDNFVYPGYLEGGAGAIPYELISWDTADLTAPYQYTIRATGGSEIRRSVFSAPTAGAGVDHPDASRFLFLDPTGQGLLKLQLDPKWIGQALKFKFTAFNTLGGGMQDLADVTAYPYTPTGGVNVNPNANNYTNDPAVSLSQPNATHIAMAQVAVTFPSNAVNYNARSFVISDPGGTPQVYFVTIHDPAYVGDIGTGTDKTAYCETTQAKVGLPGYTYMGSIVAVHAPPTGNIETPGGWPPDPTFLVNGA